MTAGLQGAGRLMSRRAVLALALALATCAAMLAGATIAAAAPGELDPHFGSAGSVGTPFSVLEPSEDSLSAVASVPGGKTIAVGTTMPKYDSDHSDLVVVRYNPDGSLDQTFGDHGVYCVCVEIDPQAVAVDSLGRIVIAGSASVEGHSDFAVLRLRTNGSLDPSFGGGGIVFTALEDASSATDVTIQGDGRVLVSGLSWTDRNHRNFALARYNADGSLDASFGTHGRVVTSLTARTFDSNVAVLNSGKIVVAGDADQRSFAILRYNPEGTPDTSFGGDGTVSTSFGEGQQAPTAVLAQPDGKVVAAGFYTNNAGVHHFALARYLDDGSLDPSFGTSGKVLDNVGGSASGALGEAAALDPNGKIVVAGSADDPFESGVDAFAVVRYLANGTRDTAFGDGGAAITRFDMPGFATAVSLDGQGRIIAAGTIGNTVEIPDGRYYDYVDARFDFALARYRANGSLDPGFGDAGKVQTNLYSNRGQGKAVLQDLLVRPTGGLVAAGSTAFSDPPYFGDLALAAYNPNGRFDRSFGTGGQSITDLGGDHQAYTATAVMLPDGKTLVGGRSVSGFLARYTPNGSLDESFGDRGVVRSDVATSIDRLVPESSGGILASIHTKWGTALARFRPNGILDKSFGNRGIVPIPYDLTPSSILIEPKRIVLVAPASNMFMLLGFTLDGRRDDSFGHRGKVSTGFFAGPGYPNAATIAPDGKLVVVGESDSGDNGGARVALARYEPNGRLDRSFGERGKVLTRRPGYHSASSVVVQPDGKIITGEIAAPPGSIRGRDEVFAISRYTTRGMLDPSFGDGGMTTTSISGRPESAVLMPNGDVVVGGDSPDGYVILAAFKGGELPRADRRLSIHYRARTGMFRGRLRSERFACVEGQDVRIFQKRPGDDRSLGVDQAGKSGRYRVRGRVTHGRYYAKVKGSVATGAAICRSAESRVLRVAPRRH